MAKNNQKCLRLSDEVLQMVEGYRGEGFNEKFECLVLDFFNSIPKRKSELDKIDNLIKLKKKQLEEIETRFSKMNSLLFDIEAIRRLVFQVNANAENMPVVSQIPNLAALQLEVNEIQPPKIKRKKNA